MGHSGAVKKGLAPMRSPRTGAWNSSVWGGASLPTRGESPCPDSRGFLRFLGPGRLPGTGGPAPFRVRVL